MNLSRTPQYLGFGFIPNGNFSHDLYEKLLGYPNLFKRLQAMDIIRAMDIQSSDAVLDFGCGAGYFTVELAKQAAKAYGIDIHPYTNQIPIPPALKDKLEYILISGERLPFEDGAIDCVLASEILPMVPDASTFLLEIRRVLKPGGRVVVSNGAGHPVIREAFERRPWFFRWLEAKYPQRMPKSYEQYCEILQDSFGTSRKDFLQEGDIRDLLQRNGFTVAEISYTPSYLAGAYFSWSQFLLYLRKGKTLTQRNFAVNFIFWSLVGVFDKKKHKGGLLCVAQKNK